jgi:hypothetical protein
MRTTTRALLILLVAACGKKDGAPPPTTQPTPAPAPAPADAAPPVKADAAPVVRAVPLEGQEFIDDARLIYRVAACADQTPVPAPIDQALVDDYCNNWTAKRMEDYRQTYLAVARPFLAGVRPKDLPPVVVYPFGGGDLITALTVFPDATEITTISLEYAGDPRRLRTLDDKKKLKDSLDRLEFAMNGLFNGGWNLSRELKNTQRTEIPGQVAHAMMALAIHGMEPTSLRYFDFNPDGTLNYLDADEIAALEKKRGHALKDGWVDPANSEAFANMEVRFRPRGGGEERVYRHIAWNLDNKNLTDDPRLMRHLVSKGDVAGMTRAASFLLWQENFSVIRDYMVKHMVWTISDATGVPPPIAAKAGLVQDTYGVFTAAYEPFDQPPNRRYNKEYLELFKGNPAREMPIHFGYPDLSKKDHMIITRRP